MSFYKTPFHLLNDLNDLNRSFFGDRVVVVSDSKYNELRKSQALDEIKTLENRAEEYEKAATRIRATVSELQHEYGLLESAADE